MQRLLGHEEFLLELGDLLAHRLFLRILLLLRTAGRLLLQGREHPLKAARLPLEVGLAREVKQRRALLRREIAAAHPENDFRFLLFRAFRRGGCLVHEVLL